MSQISRVSKLLKILHLCYDETHLNVIGHEATLVTSMMIYKLTLRLDFP